MNPEQHGGDLLRMAALAGRDPETLLDFSVNVRPEGAPAFVRAALVRALGTVGRYPSPHAEEALLAAGRYHGLPPERFVFGNGSNDQIHAVARVLKKRGTAQVWIVEPAFSEYRIACELAGLRVGSVWGGLVQAEDAALMESLQKVPAGSAVFLANPGNPSGFFRSPAACLGLMEARPDLLWIIDEAFIAYCGPEAQVSLLPQLPENALVLRSLTKFYAVPGIRLGYLVASPELATAVRQELPAWNVNAFALAAALAVFADTSDFAERTRNENAERRVHLTSVLSEVAGVRVIPSAANYVLFHCPHAPRDVQARLLRNDGIALRDCSNYVGLESGGWFRAAVRVEAEHVRLAQALTRVLTQAHGWAETQPPPQDRACTVAERDAAGLGTAGDCCEQPASCAVWLENNQTQNLVSCTDNEYHRSACRRPRATPALMLQGTSSNAGKSILAAAFCRIFRQDGYHVAPFKAQNMSLNSGVTLTGEEMGRAQLVQAQAARVDPDARMNPILLKPHSDTGSQVVVLGKALGHMDVQTYFRKKQELWGTVCTAYDALAASHDLMVLEGAGSPGEINLKQHDLVNMRMADHAGASVLLVGDIDRGGVYASFLGTWMTFSAAERRLLTGYIVNRFRGDASLLASAHTFMQERTGVPVLGTVPYIRDLAIPEEDSLCQPFAAGASLPDFLDIAVLMLGHVSNHTDFAPLALEPDVRLRQVRTVEEWGTPDVVMIPGSKSVAHDLSLLRASGLADKVLAHAAAQKWIFGICGGLQMLGRELLDPQGVESAAPVVHGLGLLDIRSSFAVNKVLVQIPRAETPLGILSGGYEIHHGQTEHGASARPLFLRADRAYASEQERICGYVTGRCWATYLHGVFDDDTFRRAWLDHVRKDVGLAPLGCQMAHYDLEKALDRLADVVREHVDLQAVYRSIGI